MNLSRRTPHEFTSFVAILAISFLLLTPLLTNAATSSGRASFFGPIVPLACHCDNQPVVGSSEHVTTAPDYGCVLQVIQNLINFGISIGILVVVFWIAIAGFQLIVSRGNPGKLTEAKSRIQNALIGIMVILSAWLIVDFVMKALYDNKSYGPWNAILADDGDHACLVARTPQDISVETVGQDITSVGAGQSATVPGGVGTGGRCSVRTTGPCSVDNLTPYFGTAATSFSKICTHESGGQSIQSTTDLAADGRPLSFGLLQLNITAHTINGVDCSKATDKVLTAATLKARSVHIINESLYAQCKNMALNPATNLSFASKLYKTPKVGFNPWRADNACGLSG